MNIRFSHKHFLVTLALIFLACEKDTSYDVDLMDVWESNFFVSPSPSPLLEMRACLVLNPDSTGLYYKPATKDCYEKKLVAISNGIVQIGNKKYSYDISPTALTLTLLDTVGLVGYPFPLDFHTIASQRMTVCY